MQRYKNTQPFKLLWLANEQQNGYDTGVAIILQTQHDITQLSCTHLYTEKNTTRETEGRTLAIIHTACSHNL